MPTSTRGAGIWQVPVMHTLLRMRAKPGSTMVDSFLQIIRPPLPPRSNTLLLVPSLLNLFSCSLMGSDYKQHDSSSSRSVAGLLSTFLFVPNSNIYCFCLHMPARLSIITPEDAKGNACSFLSDLEISIVKSYFYKPLQLAPGQHRLSC